RHLSSVRRARAGAVAERAGGGVSRPLRLREHGRAARCAATAALRARCRSGGARRPDPAVLVPPEPAEHVHREADRIDARRRVPAGAPPSRSHMSTAIWAAAYTAASPHRNDPTVANRTRVHVVPGAMTTLPLASRPPRSRVDPNIPYFLGRPAPC